MTTWGSGRDARQPRRAGSSRSAEHGSGTILVLVAMGALLAVTAAGLMVAQAVIATHRARVAADLSALAAASALRDGSPSPCARGATVAAHNGASLRSCRLEGPVVEIVVAVAVRWWPEAATARARAGPPLAREQPAPGVGGGRARRHEVGRA